MSNQTYRNINSCFIQALFPPRFESSMDRCPEDDLWSDMNLFETHLRYESQT